MHRWLGLLLLALLGGARADEQVMVCYGYGCAHQAPALFADSQLDPLLARLGTAHDGVDERRLLAEAVGQLYGWAGQQTPIHADRGGNYADEGRRGSMDCIDHSLTTTRLLTMLANRGGLHFHHVIARVLRTRGMIFEHYSAAIAESGEGARRYAVDSWFVDNGKPAVILPLDEWMDGGGPDV
ncbi:hypothetical protein B9N43_08265 [Denitratisoma sp. DHT3]|uniref:hypothetical protein n=1 Tax=Denitratisoma sp. DHT3 TaxID=1981880 RepID=UPI00119840A3|nr:hypothetical protein [Denitratisoma sp. DHT3]QDX81233.1 hypothetical protein B9N43_08265 [Denitratisoma sp. DHT3]